MGRKHFGKCIKRISLYLTFATCLICLLKMKVSALIIETEDYYYIASALDNNQVLDVAGGSHDNGTNIQLYRKNGSDAQLFRIIQNQSDGYFTIINKGSGKVLDVEGGKTDSGTNVQLYEYNGTPAQQWKLYLTKEDSEEIYIISQCGKSLDVSGGNTENGTNIEIYDLNCSQAQIFRLIPYVNTTYETVKLEFDDIQTWQKEMEKAQRSVAFGGSFATNPSGNTYYNGKIIMDMRVLAWKTIKVKVPLVGPGNPYRLEEWEMPSEIQFKLHTHNNETRMWCDFTRLNFWQQCECGYRDEWTWDFPYPDFTENSDAQTTNKVIKTIQPQWKVLHTIQP